MAVFACVPGLRVEAVGDAWIAFSPASGETLLLNDTSAAILELLSERPMTPPALLEQLATDAAMPPDEVATQLGDHWLQLVEAGLVRQVEPKSA